MSKNIGKTLKECRTAANITVKEISELLTQRGFKASESTVYSWENDNSQPTPGALLTMCTAYGIEDVLSTFGYNGYKEDGSLRLNMNEQNLIEKYRIIAERSPKGKKNVDFIIESEYEQCISPNLSGQLSLEDFIKPEDWEMLRKCAQLPDSSFSDEFMEMFGFDFPDDTLCHFPELSYDAIPADAAHTRTDIPVTDDDIQHDDDIMDDGEY